MTNFDGRWDDLPQCAKERWSVGYWMDGVLPKGWGPVVEEWTTKLAEIDPGFTYQDIKVKFGSARVYVTTSSFPSGPYTEEEYNEACAKFFYKSDQLHEMANKFEEALTAALKPA